VVNWWSMGRAINYQTEKGHKLPCFAELQFPTSLYLFLSSRLIEILHPRSTNDATKGYAAIFASPSSDSDITLIISVHRQTYRRRSDAIGHNRE